MFFVVLVGGIYTNAQFVLGGQKTTSSVSPPASLPFVLGRVSPGPVTLAIQTGPAGPSPSRDSAESNPITEHRVISVCHHTWFSTWILGIPTRVLILVR